MQTMNVSLPDQLKDFVDRQIADGRYSSVSEYIGELIRADEKQKSDDQLERLLLEGLGGLETEMTRDDWTSVRETALREVQARKKKANA